ncbi:aspartate aminotransferase family protein [Actinobacteria bacterium YIM 96077]|uniref:Aspartate aminotransferase family protein n=1 Tax=Phytoactinopolyspora halophila TaxID=1981511 RepID=A0A329QJR0_9ACTN|nr:aspartate aminotransferase family protein [Phytoactinopolyspora halophila]AYY13606.1 aspartate aminotransferase family protein [Actinobacteria bacterium YIM 96077]RAW10728.1 aspartate aminotransferase family protein [Phytoactinopolyspora halophila]
MDSDRSNHPHSGELHRRANQRVPGGVHSNIRLVGPQAYVSEGRGAWLYGVDGEEYVDYLLGQGPNFLGHAPTSVLDAVDEASRKGTIYAGQHPLEVEASELLCEVLGWPDMVRFCVSGTEAVQAALRLARAVTGRTGVISFEGHYHGWLDNVLAAPGPDGSWRAASAGQVPGHLDDLTVLPWNDIDVLAEVLRHGRDEIAAVIMEPIMINSGVIEPIEGYLDKVRQLCSQYGVVLIFDEVISGFRVGLDGAVGRYGVRPDLATYGKAMAGGWPAAALVGRRDLMEWFGSGTVNHSGTFNASVMATAATIASLTYLRNESPYAGVEEYGTALMDGLRECAESHGLPLRVAGLPAAFHVSFGDEGVTDYRSLQRLDLERYQKLAGVLVDHGLWVAGRGVWYVSVCHGSEELDATLLRFAKALNDWS